MLWNPQAQTTDGSLGVRQNPFGFNIAGTAGIPLVIEASTDLADAPWLPSQTCTAHNGAGGFRRGVLVCVADIEVAFDGSAHDREVGFGPARARCSAGFYALLHDSGADSPGGFGPFGLGLLRLRLGGQNGAPRLVDRVFGNQHVRSCIGGAADRRGALSPVG
jgi:hypothetical protein